MNKQIICNKLISKGVKPTAMRLLVYEILASSQIALSLSDIETNFDQADRITLYRTLKTFEKRGVIHSIQENTTTKYALCSETCTSQKHLDEHLHFYCTQCNKTICIESITMGYPKAPLGFEVFEYRFFAKGICPNCRSHE